MENAFQDKTAVITGGTSGIGKAVAKKLAKESANVVIAGTNKDKGNTAEKDLQKIHGGVKYVSTDIADKDQVENLFNQTEELFGGTDFLFNNAGREGAMAPVTDFPADSCDELTDVNVKGTFLVAKYALAQMLKKGGGAIVNNASFVGTTVPFPDGLMYGATKAAVLSMTSSLSVGYKEKGIRVFAVCPWMTETPMVERLTGGNKEIRAQLKQLNPSGRFAKPEDIAEVVTQMFAGAGDYGEGEAYLIDADAQTQQLQIPYQIAN